MPGSLKIRGHELLAETTPEGITAGCRCGKAIPFNSQVATWPSGRHYQDSQKGISRAHKAHLQDVLNASVVAVSQIARQISVEPPPARVNGARDRERTAELRAQARALCSRHATDPDLIYRVLVVLAQKHPMDAIRTIHELRD